MNVPPVSAAAEAALKTLEHQFHAGGEGEFYAALATLAAALERAEREIERLTSLNSGLTRDFNAMLIEQSKQRNRAEAAGRERDEALARIPIAEFLAEQAERERDDLLREWQRFENNPKKRLLDELHAAERERERFRIEADQGLTEYDGLELSFGIVGDALQQIATGRRNQRFDPWAQKLARETLASLPEQHRAALVSPAADDPERSQRMQDD
jgi:hypothetical protein